MRPTTQKPIDISRTGDGREFLDEVVHVFLGHLPTLRAEAHAACAPNDATWLEVVAHSLTGPALNVCAEPTRALAEPLEKMARTGSSLGGGSCTMSPASGDSLAYRGRVTMDNALHGLRALIVDDNEFNRRTLVEMLTHLSLKPTAVDSATSALTALRTALDEQCPYPLALLGCMLPEMDGMSLARRIRSDDRLDGMSLIMLSSAGQVADPACLRSLNISHCLTKPIKESDLLNAIMRAVAGRSEPGEEMDRRAGLTDGSLDREAVWALAGQDEALVSEIIQTFLEEAPQQLGEIDRALADGDAQRLQRAAHKFKGSAMLFSARSTVEAARELEERCRASDLIGAREVHRRLHEDTARLRESLLRWNRELGDTA